MRFGRWIGFFLIACCLALVAFQVTKSESVVTFYTPPEIYAKPQKFYEKTFRVSGLVMKGSVKHENRAIHFLMTDLKKHDFYVTYKGIPPDMFREGQGVVVEGQLLSMESRPFRINASLLMVKHSEVYDTKVNHSELREAKLLDSLNR